MSSIVRIFQVTPGRMLILYNPPSSASRKPILPLSLLALGAVLEASTTTPSSMATSSRDPLAALDALIREHGRPMLG